MIHKTYILFSEAKNRFYVGSTRDDLSQRIRRHNSNHKGYTGNTTDWVLKYHELFSTKKEALNREREIKAWKSRIKILALINKLS
jgi:putative endonuclease